MANENRKISSDTEIEKAITFLLSRKEHDVLCLWICGYTAKDVAKLFKASHRTIQTYHYRIRLKLKISNMIEAKQLIERGGLISHCFDTSKNLVSQYTENRLEPVQKFIL